jgi:hypothetical protein
LVERSREKLFVRKDGRKIVKGSRKDAKVGRKTNSLLIYLVCVAGDVDKLAYTKQISPTKSVICDQS